ncbi:hypothetical protein, partial [Ruegeria arenilitoris]|uniref:hypothetical protein n=1 Tax=Ruegeria arenilitoris TaxID=1173585 RepID=UPI001C2C2600
QADDALTIKLDQSDEAAHSVMRVPTSLRKTAEPAQLTAAFYSGRSYGQKTWPGSGPEERF